MLLLQPERRVATEVYQGTKRGNQNILKGKTDVLKIVPRRNVKAKST